MKFKEFAKWCNDRWFDGCWGMTEAMICMNTLEEMKKVPFWKREKTWKEKFENQIVNHIVKPTNELILKYLEENKNEIIQNN